MSCRLFRIRNSFWPSLESCLLSFYLSFPVHKQTERLWTWVSFRVQTPLLLSSFTWFLLSYPMHWLIYKLCLYIRLPPHWLSESNERRDESDRRKEQVEEEGSWRWWDSNWRLSNSTYPIRHLWSNTISSPHQRQQVMKSDRKTHLSYTRHTQETSDHW